eukprot:TRINITY_DN9228_c0_g1_i1.p1 TRINITY_DN9228_c0_g1~~TRINITY_DN9228_c0_g1_i1.p1  ORF type:complete len:232 (-),score=17.44 TRINITY_DN9228_c0_g1_i1:374-1069(-)
MERVNPVSAKRLWNVIRIAFFMIRKGISKRKLLMDMHMMMKRGKVCGKNLRNLMFHGGNAHKHQHGFGLQEYEFSCSNSPANPVQFLWFSGNNGKRKHHSSLSSQILHFSCIHPHQKDDFKYEDNDDDGFSFPQLVYDNEFFSKESLDAAKVPKSPSPSAASDMQLSPMLSPFHYSRRQSNYSASADEENGGDKEVDRLAEEFIAKFYQQLRMQHQQSVRQYQEMLRRGAE